MQDNVIQIPVAEIVKQELGSAAKTCREFSASHNATVYLVDMEDNQRLVVKMAKDNSQNLATEGWMLQYLADNSDLPIPEVFCAKDHVLIMSYLPDCGRIDEGAQLHAADLLAALHKVKGDRYGFERDTLIGPLVQPNTWEDDWITFFGEHRLLYMANEAHKEGSIDDDTLKRIERLIGKLSLYLDVPTSPTLLHGDVWDGNVLALPGRIVGFIDPALYFGAPEIELAFTTLFGTFGQSFFNRYQDHHTIQPGFFEERRDIYNLYPLLVHVRLFGDMYKDNLETTLSGFA